MRALINRDICPTSRLHVGMGLSKSRCGIVSLGVALSERNDETGKLLLPDNCGHVDV